MLIHTIISRDPLFKKIPKLGNPVKCSLDSWTNETFAITAMVYRKLSIFMSVPVFNIILWNITKEIAFTITRNAVNYPPLTRLCIWQLRRWQGVAKCNSFVSDTYFWPINKIGSSLNVMREMRWSRLINYINKIEKALFLLVRCNCGAIYRNGVTAKLQLQVFCLL